MKSFEIKITGSGTKNQIECSLRQIARELQDIEVEELINRNHVMPFFEDEILCADVYEG